MALLNSITMKEQFKVGDVVVVISDPAIRYTITVLYGTNNAYALCAYYNANDELAELSIPVVALMKYEDPDGKSYGNNNQPVKRYVYFY